jgi:tetratricopeptide (TPR) repeat protein
MVATVRERLAQEPGAASGLPLFTFVGGGGIGKTALAVHLAHLLADRFPDGQLYVNLRGAEAQPLASHDVLDFLLRSLGVEPDRIPPDRDGRVSYYRALLSTGRRLVVLDNASDEGQVRPLIPGGGDNLVLITSRNPLTGVESATRLTMDVLSPDDAVRLMARIIGEDRLAAEPEAADELARSCGYLPLALRIAAARLASRPHWRLSRMVTRLADENRRLTELEAGDLTVRSSFVLSYEALDPDSRRLFRYATLLPAQTFPAWVAGALLDQDVDDGESLVEHLVELRLLEYAGRDEAGQARYQYHDLLRLFARERLAAEDSPQERSAAVERLIGGYLALAMRGLYLMSPHSKRDEDWLHARQWPLPDWLVEEVMAEPYNWFSAEYEVLVGAIGQAHSSQLLGHSYELAEQMHYYFRVRSHLRDWQRTHELALDAARRAGDRAAEGWTLRNLGNALLDQSRYGEAVSRFGEAATIFQEIGNTLGGAAALCNLGEARMTQGRFAAAVENLVACLPGWEAVDDQVGIAYTLDNLGFIAHRQGDYARAREYLALGLAKFRELGDRFGEAHSLRRRAELAIELGDAADLDGALADVRHSREIFVGMGSQIGAAWAAIAEAGLLLHRGEVTRAVSELTDAVRVGQEHADPRAAAWAMIRLGEALAADGRQAEATAVLGQAADSLTAQDDEFGAAVAAFRHGQSLARQDLPDARGTLERAREVFGQLDCRRWAERVEEELRSLA